MRLPLLLALIAVTVTVANAASIKQSHPYRKHWKKATFGKRALAGVGARAAGAQLTRHPRKWGGGAGGLGKRLGSGFAGHAVKTTVEHAVAAPLHEDLHYHRSTKRGFGHRMGHALASTVVTRNTKTGSRTPAVGKISGHAAAGAVTQGVLHAGAGASTAGIGLGAEAGANVAREFWPRRHKHLKSAGARRRPRSRKSAG
ncbi:MAG: hypothetical protein U0Q18_28555 [Bryobacteraceae bacterium]